ncbi:DUF7512 family protein [Salarchaeum japonicum]|uniref:Uncharacterized protein n=2 Tax=Salarchaeum japonicum TaxID=555573 RepID=A0AAV3T3X1_9EURY
MVGLESVSGSVQAGLTVGTVLAEAIALYLAYGALSETVGASVLDALGGD